MQQLTIKVPLFHAAGLYVFINVVLYWNTPVAFGVERPLSSDLVMESLKNLEVNVAFLPPAILEDMSQDETCIKALQTLSSVCFGGGKLTFPRPFLCFDETCSLINNAR